MSVFRKEYRALTDVESARIDNLKDIADNLYNIINVNELGIDQRCLAVAKTKLEEVVMWATKGFSA